MQLRWPKLEAGVAAGLTLIVAVMPYHAFLSVWLGSLSGHEQIIQSWKEVLLLVLGLIVLAGLITRTDVRQRLARPTVILIGIFSTLAIIVTIGFHPQASGVAYGIKTDLEFLLAYVLAVAVGASLSPTRLGRIILYSGVITALIGLALVTILPHDSLRHFGYSNSTISPFERVDPAIAAVRTPSTLGGPNQFGAYLIVPFALALVYGLRRRQLRYAVAAAVMAGGIYVSYSRAALIGAVLAALTIVILALPKRLVRLGLVASGGVIIVAMFVLLYASNHTQKFGYYVLHQNPKTVTTQASTSQHIISFKHGLGEIGSNPWGRGLGSAGPASFHTSSAFIPESYYLQIGIETGILGLVIFILLLLTLSRDLLIRSYSNEARAALAALISLSFVSLVLHGWADSSVSLVYWIFAGSLIGSTALEPTEQVMILGVRFDNLTFNEAVERIAAMIAERQGGLVATVNAEFVVHAQRDTAYRELLNRSALSLADGSGPTLMSRYLGTLLRARIPGVELTEALMQRAARDGWRVYILGGFDGVGQAAAAIWNDRYAGLAIAGVSEPDADQIDDATLITTIRAAKPDLILVALGGAVPRQEPWIDRHLGETGAVIGIGIGGTLDYVTSRRPRAPKLYRQLGLEWLYRLVRQPSRLKRMSALPYFVYLVLRYRSRPRK